MEKRANAGEGFRTSMFLAAGERLQGVGVMGSWRPTERARSSSRFTRTEWALGHVRLKNRFVSYHSQRRSYDFRSRAFHHLQERGTISSEPSISATRYASMSFIFGKKKSPAELLRENKRMLDRSIREIERERQGLQTQEKKLIAEIKKSAKQGQIGAVRVMAKDLIRTRHQITKFYALKSQLQGVSLRIQTLKSTQAMGEAMKGVTKAMTQMNRQMNLPALQRIMQEFERQNEKMELVGEVMSDAIDDALEGDEEEMETDELVNQVLDEIGIDINSELVKAPSSTIAAPSAPSKVAQAEGMGPEDGGIDEDLQARLDNLRKM